MIPVLLDNTKRLTDLLTDDTCVLRLKDALSCTVEEEANGAYTAELVLPLTDDYVKHVTAGAIIKLKANPYDKLQLFRVATVTKSMTKITAELKHITYDLSKTSVMPCTAGTAPEAFSVIKNSMHGGDEFTLTTTLETKSTFTNKTPQSARALLGGQEGSLLDVYGGFYYWDNLTVTLGKRGSDNGVTIRYGKNLVSAEQEESIENMYTAVQPYVTINEQTITGTYKELIAGAYPVRVLNLDLSSSFNTADATGTEAKLPTVADIDKECEAYVKRNDLTHPSVALTVSYEDLRKYGDQYKEEVRLCDTVHVYFEKLGIKAGAKVTKYAYDTLAEKYTSVQIGKVKSKLSNSIASMISASADKVTQSQNSIQATANAFTNLITNGLGLFKTVETQPDGSVKVYLHNRRSMADSDVWYTMNADGFALSRDKGKTWQAGFDKDGNAVLNVLAANIIKAMQIYGTYIEGGTIKSPTIIFTADETGEYDIKTIGTYATSQSGEKIDAGVLFHSPTGKGSVTYNVEKIRALLASGFEVSIKDPDNGNVWTGRFNVTNDRFHIGDKNTDIYDLPENFYVQRKDKMLLWANDTQIGIGTKGLDTMITQTVGDTVYSGKPVIGGKDVIQLYADGGKLHVFVNGTLYKSI